MAGLFSAAQTCCLDGKYVLRRMDGTKRQVRSSCRSLFHCPQTFFVLVKKKLRSVRPCTISDSVCSWKPCKSLWKQREKSSIHGRTSHSPIDAYPSPESSELSPVSPSSTSSLFQEETPRQWLPFTPLQTPQASSPS